MSSIKAAVLLAGVTLALIQTPQGLTAQGKGGGKGQDRGAQGKGNSKGPEKNRGNDVSQAKGRDNGPDKNRGAEQGKGRGVEKVSSPSRSENAKGARAQFARPASARSMPNAVRKYASSKHARDLVVAAAVSHAFARGRGDDIRMEQVGDRMRLSNRKGDQLLFIDDRSAENLGRWRVGVVDDNVREGAPSFCRTGAGHPVWGREWCIDKGFGLGSYEDYRWGRTTDIGDIIYSRRSTGDRFVGTALESLLGSTAFNRLALHAITLGLVEPLVGTFIGEPTGPQFFSVNSGAYPVAELYDSNRDSRWDNLLVALRPW